MPDYSEMDRSPLVHFLFHPRRDFTECPKGAFDFSIPVEPEVAIFCRFYPADQGWPWILYFHGNGEVVSDYDEIAPLYHKIKANLVVADYRGYGRSGGAPSFTALIQDASQIFKAVKEELKRRGFSADLWVMGKSLGSISALELAATLPDQMKGIVIESGFASVTRLVNHLGLPHGGINLEPIEKERFAMIGGISVPALIIHGEVDNLVPLEEAQDLYANLGSKEKDLVIIPEADHNNVMFVNLGRYLSAIQKFVEKTKFKNSSTKGRKQ
jgi:uncharacterized protein